MGHTGFEPTTSGAWRTDRRTDIDCVCGADKLRWSQGKWEDNYLSQCSLTAQQLASAPSGATISPPTSSSSDSSSSTSTCSDKKHETRKHMHRYIQNTNQRWHEIPSSAQQLHKCQFKFTFTSPTRHETAGSSNQALDNNGAQLDSPLQNQNQTQPRKPTQHMIATSIITLALLVTMRPSLSTPSVKLETERQVALLQRINHTTTIWEESRVEKRLKESERRE